MDYSKLIHPDSFIASYMKHMNTKETPYAYDFWTAIWLIGHTIGRKVLLSRPGAPVFLNWFVILVANSGITRKSTAVRMGSMVVDALAELERRNDYQNSSVHISTRTSTEALEMVLHDYSREFGHAHCTITISELVTFMGRQKYTMDMPGFLTDLYDCPANRVSSGTIARGSTLIRDVYVSLLSASTPSWLIRAVNPDVIEGGFTSRCMFIVNETRKRAIAWPQESQYGNDRSAATQFASLLYDLRRECHSTGDIPLHPRALAAFEGWYSGRQEHSDAFRSSFESREDAHVLRLAACLAINDRAFEVQDFHIERSIKLIDQVKSDGAKLFEGAMSNTRIVLGIDRIRSLLIGSGHDGMLHRDLFIRVRDKLSNEEYKIILEIMHELGMLQIFQTQRSNIYRATKEMLAPGCIDEVMKHLEPEDV